MKHNLKITIIILGMFIIAQLIGLFVVNFYLDNSLPYGMGASVSEQQPTTPGFVSILIAFVIGISLVLLLTRIEAKFVLKFWFFAVVMIALGVAFTVFLTKLFPSSGYLPYIALILALPLALTKIYSRNLISHNFSELFIYPGVAAIFIPLLNVLYLIILLILISVYDMWAVWKSGIMQKMAKFQINELKIFSGFFIPYMSKKERARLKKLKQSKVKNKKIKVSLAILGGGDVVFPIISSGVILKTLGLVPALLVILGALLGLGILFMFSEKKKFYPAMPFISAGILLAIGISYLVF